jgi:hypothetical protein
MVMDSTETYAEGPICVPFSASIFVCHHNFDRYVRNCDSGPNKCDLVPLESRTDEIWLVFFGQSLDRIFHGFALAVATVPPRDTDEGLPYFMPIMFHISRIWSFAGARPPAPPIGFPRVQLRLLAKRLIESSTGFASDGDRDDIVIR